MNNLSAKTYTMGVEAIERMDWDAIAAYMKLTKWCYTSEKDSPTAGRVKALAMRLLNTVCDSGTDNTRAMSGGITVTRFIWDHKNNKDIDVRVAFELEAAGTGQRLED